MRLYPDGTIVFDLPSGGTFTGNLWDVNALLMAMGYGKVAVRTNLMSRKEFIEAEGTPYYCSPSSETYWSS
jgi:hypothetical protein